MKELIFTDVARGFPDLDEHLSLNAENPMPLWYKKAWTDVQRDLHKALSKRDKSLAPRWALVSDQTVQTVKRKLSWWPEVIFATTALIAIFGSIIVGFVLLAERTDSSIRAGMGFVCASILLMMIAMFVNQLIGNKPGGIDADSLFKDSPDSLSIFNREYVQRVQRWALTRYGVTLENPWYDAVAHQSKDKIYVTESNGQNFYLYQMKDGWIMGAETMTELPVLVKS